MIKQESGKKVVGVDGAVESLEECVQRFFRVCACFFLCASDLFEVSALDTLHYTSL
jgi:hypothetical protein